MKLPNPRKTRKPPKVAQLAKPIGLEDFPIRSRQPPRTSPYALSDHPTAAQVAKAFLPWSYSKLAAYQKCPRAAFYRYVARHPEGKSEALIRGNDVHAKLETWARQGFPAEASPLGKTWAKHVETELAPPVRDRMIVEEMWSFDAKLRPVPYQSPSEWVRIKCDLAFPAAAPPRVIDWKTGKIYDEHTVQGTIYGAAFLSRFEGVKLVQVEFWYSDLGDVRTMEVARNDVPATLSRYAREVDRMLADRDFLPKPSRLCDWCGFSRTKGGPCRAG